jgi:hypothetical protein
MKLGLGLVRCFIQGILPHGSALIVGQGGLTSPFQARAQASFYLSQRACGMCPIRHIPTHTTTPDNQEIGERMPLGVTSTRRFALSRGGMPVASGMSLVEVMIAMGLASVLFVGVTQMSSIALKSSRNVAQITEWSELRNNIRTTMRSYQGCTRTLRLLHNPLNTTSPGNIPAPGTADVGGQLVADATLPAPNLIRPIRMAAPPLPEAAQLTVPCNNPAFSSFTLTGQDRMATVGSTTNGLQVTCVYAEVLNVGALTSWTAPPPAVPAGWPQAGWPQAGWPQDIPGGPMSAGATGNVRQVTYRMTVTARKVQLNQNEQELGNTFYREEIPILAWVNAQTGKVLGCASDLAAACQELGGSPRPGQSPECVFNHMVLETRPNEGTRYTDAEAALRRANGAINPLQGLYARGGISIALGLEASSGTTFTTSTTAAGGITFDNGKTGAGAQDNMAAIRVHAPFGFTNSGELFIIGQPNNANAGAAPAAPADDRRVAVRASGGMRIEGPLSIAQPDAVTRAATASIFNAGSGTTGLRISTSSTAPYTGQVSFYTGNFDVNAVQSASLSASNGSTEVRSNSGTRTAAVRVNAAVGSQIALEANDGNILFDLGSPGGTMMFTDSGALPGATLSIGTGTPHHVPGHLQLGSRGTIQTGAGPRWRVLAMGKQLMSYGHRNPCCGDTSPARSNRTPVISIPKEGCEIANTVVISSLEVPWDSPNVGADGGGDPFSHQNNSTNTLKHYIRDNGSDFNLQFVVHYSTANMFAYSANYIVYCVGL